MGMQTTVYVEGEHDVEVDDDDIVAYVSGNRELFLRIIADRQMEHGAWADAFMNEDAVGQEQMLAALRRVCPHMTISR
jgi:hypothetical protein